MHGSTDTAGGRGAELRGGAKRARRYLGGPGPSSDGIGKIGGTRRNAASYPSDIRSSLVLSQQPGGSYEYRARSTAHTPGRSQSFRWGQFCCLLIFQQQGAL
eukprot:COSAG01_NODE_32893_length_573_cov_1.793249_1_plen_101_part_10